MAISERNPERNTERKTAVSFGNTGSITVEACILVPILVLTLLACGYLSIIMYEKTNLYNLAFTASDNPGAGELELSAGRLLKPVRSNILSSSNRTIFSTQNTAKIQNTYKLPWGGYVNVSVAAQQVHCDYSSFISNIDFFQEISIDFINSFGDIDVAAEKIAEMDDVVGKKAGGYEAE